MNDRLFIIIIMRLWRHTEVYKCQKVPLKNVITIPGHTPKIIFASSMYPIILSDVGTLLEPWVWLWHNPHVTRDLANKSMSRKESKVLKSLQTTQYKNW